MFPSFDALFSMLKSNPIILGILLLVIVGLVGRYVYTWFRGNGSSNNTSDGVCISSHCSEEEAAEIRKQSGMHSNEPMPPQQFDQQQHTQIPYSGQ